MGLHKNAPDSINTYVWEYVEPLSNFLYAFSFYNFRDATKRIPEWGIVELQGDLEVRGDRIMNGQFIGDLCYDKYGQPVSKWHFYFLFNYTFHSTYFNITFQILIIGHHILHGKEQKIEKPFVVLHRTRHYNANANENETTPNIDGNELNDTAIDLNDTNISLNRTVLDSTIAIEHKTKQKTEYHVKAIIRKKVIFKSRPKPIIANVAKQV